MFKKKTDLAIVNRAFWPQSPVIGGALLELAEKVAHSKHVCIITQANGNLANELKNAKRGQGVIVKACRSNSSVKSRIITRLLDGFIFMVWTLYCLIITRPKKVYVSTNPPIFIPFVVFLYCLIFRAKYFYHLQDIHPEAANIIIPLFKPVFWFLQSLDSIVMRNATGIMTLSEGMKTYIISRSQTKSPIILIDNPAFTVSASGSINKTRDIVFCGTAGRLQRIPLLLESIESYLSNGGTLDFTFIGSGIYLQEIQRMAKEFSSVSCLGFLSSKESAEIVSQHRWALLPIDDEVTRYAFPSRSSSYVASNCNILAICSENTSVADWVEKNKLGVVSKPYIESIVSHYKSIEEGDYKDRKQNCKFDYSVSCFAEKALAFIDS
jgi:hypothetical protein